MAVITQETNLRRAIKRLTTSTGASADFVSEPSALSTERSPHVVVYDARHHEALPEDFLKRLAPEARILCIIDRDQLMRKVGLLDDPRVDSLFCHDERFDDEEFIASATKALRGEVFGLQKYFPWGVTAFSILVKNYQEKSAAIDVLLEYATLAGVRGPVKDRVQLVCDELIMNALYHAPVDDLGNEKYAGRTVKELAQLPEVSPIRVQYAHSGRYFGVSVRDGFGSLSRARLLEYLKKAHAGASMEDKAGGAGLGLVSILRSTSKLVFNLQPGSATEAIGLFDMELFGKGHPGARSLHVFNAAENEERQEDRGREARQDKPPLASTKLWATVAALCVVLGVLIGALLLRSKRSAKAEPTAPPAPALIVIDNNIKGTQVELGGVVVSPGQPVEVPAGPSPVPLVIRKSE